MKRRYRWLRLVLVGALAVGGLAATAGPAHAAGDPPCTDNAVPKSYELSADFDQTYTITTHLPGRARAGIDCTLSPGAHNWSVVVLQVALNDCLFKNPRALKVDGIYGTDTTNAVKFLQTLEGITADGVYGPVTALHMRWGYRLYGSSPSDRPRGCYYYWTMVNGEGSW